MTTLALTNSTSPSSNHPLILPGPPLPFVSGSLVSSSLLRLPTPSLSLPTTVSVLCALPPPPTETPGPPTYHDVSIHPLIADLRERLVRLLKSANDEAKASARQQREIAALTTQLEAVAPERALHESLLASQRLQLKEWRKLVEKAEAEGKELMGEVTRLTAVQQEVKEEGQRRLAELSTAHTTSVFALKESHSQQMRELRQSFSTEQAKVTADREEAQRDREGNRLERERLAKVKRAMEDKASEEPTGESMQRWKQQKLADDRLIQRLKGEVQGLKEQLDNSQREGEREKRERERERERERGTKRPTYEDREDRDRSREDERRGHKGKKR